MKTQYGRGFWFSLDSGIESVVIQRGANLLDNLSQLPMLGSRTRIYTYSGLYGLFDQFFFPGILLTNAVQKSCKEMMLLNMLFALEAFVSIIIPNLYELLGLSLVDECKLLFIGCLLLFLS